MIYRKLPHGDEKLGILGLGTNSLAEGDPGEILCTYEMAMERGINLFDLAGKNTQPFALLGCAMKGKRSRVYMQMHFGADYPQCKCGWTQDLKRIEELAEMQLHKLKTDYIDFGFLHCLDQPAELGKTVSGGAIELTQKYKQQGKVRHIGFFSHNPATVHIILDMHIMDTVMCSINPAYDYTDKEGYGGGRLLDEKHRLLTKQPRSPL